MIQRKKTTTQSGAWYRQPATIIILVFLGLFSCCSVLMFVIEGRMRGGGPPSSGPLIAHRAEVVRGPSAGDLREEFLDSLKLQPLSVLMSASFKRKHGLPTKTSDSGDWVHYYYSKGDFSVQVSMSRRITVNVYEGRVP